MQKEFVMCMSLLVGSGDVRLTFFEYGFSYSLPFGGGTLRGFARQPHRGTTVARTYQLGSKFGFAP